MAKKMMAIIEAPKDCDHCPFNYDYIECCCDDEGKVKMHNKDFDWGKVDENCPLKPIPFQPFETVVKVWKKTTLTKEELEKAFEDNDFRSYMEMVINKEIERRIKESRK